MNTSFIKSKFDNCCLLFMIVFFICLLTWVDKHGNGDYEKWLEVFIAGFGGAYLGLIKGDRTTTGPPQQTRTGDINNVTEVAPVAEAPKNFVFKKP